MTSLNLMCARYFAWLVSARAQRGPPSPNRILRAAKPGSRVGLEPRQRACPLTATRAKGLLVGNTPCLGMGKASETADKTPDRSMLYG